MVLVEGAVDGGVLSDPPSDMSVSELGRWLVATQEAVDRWQAGWLAALVSFDLDHGWAVDGMINCAHWLVVKLRLSRSSAHERLRVAHELRRRPLLAAAYAEGRVSWSAVRAITRAVGATAAVDAALVDLAGAGTVTDVERTVAAYLRHADQDRPPVDPTARRSIRMVPLGDGTTRIEAIVTDLEAAEIDVALTAMATAAPARAGRDSPVEEAVDESPADTRPQGDPGPTWIQRRVDALVAMARTELTAAPAADRYMVHLVVAHDTGCLLGGEDLDRATVDQIRCDCATVTHHLDASGEPLGLGRRTRTWTTAQRRAITVRDGGRCRWPGCTHRHVDVHHVIPWDDGGPTDTRNGMLLCTRHHTLIHRGFTTSGTPTGAVTFHRPDRTPIATTQPHLRSRIRRRLNGGDDQSQ